MTWRERERAGPGPPGHPGKPRAMYCRGAVRVRLFHPSIFKQKDATWCAIAYSTRIVVENTGMKYAVAVFSLLAGAASAFTPLPASRYSLFSGAPAKVPQRPRSMATARSKVVMMPIGVPKVRDDMELCLE